MPKIIVELCVGDAKYFLEQLKLNQIEIPIGSLSDLFGSPELFVFQGERDWNNKKPSIILTSVSERKQNA